jgi:hypothetical protein
VSRLAYRQQPVGALLTVPPAQALDLGTQLHPLLLVQRRQAGRLRSSRLSTSRSRSRPARRPGGEPTTGPAGCYNGSASPTRWRKHPLQDRQMRVKPADQVLLERQISVTPAEKQADPSRHTDHHATPLTILTISWLHSPPTQSEAIQLRPTGSPISGRGSWVDLGRGASMPCRHRAPARGEHEVKPPAVAAGRRHDANAQTDQPPQPERRASASTARDPQRTCLPPRISACGYLTASKREYLDTYGRGVRLRAATACRRASRSS